MADLRLCVLFLFIGANQCTDASHKQHFTENILINVTARTLTDSNNLQINFNVSVGEEQFMINDVPIELSGVARLNCQAVLLENVNGSKEFEPGYVVSTVTRVMLSQYSVSAEVMALRVLSEVIELDDQKVQQPDMCEVKILISPDYQKLAQYTNIYPFRHSDLFSLPRENDVVVTDPPTRKKEDQMMSQTTSDYPLEQTDTTQEEVAAPGKLPETPLRMDPDILYDEDFDEASQEDQMKGKEFNSPYSAVCQWVEEARERLKRFCYESLPLFFLVMWVVVIGVAGSAVIVKILDIVFPSCEQKNILQLNSITLVPEEEKHILLENVQLEPEEDKTP